MRNGWLLGAAAVALAACGPKTAAPPPAPAPVTAPEPEPAAPARPAAPGTALPSPDQAARYMGRWAAAVAACDDEAWVFRRDGLDGPAGARCTFEAVGRTASGYEITARCAGPARRGAATLHLRFAESAKAMLVDGGPFGSGAGLIWCGPS
jgi:hypothetical protein